MTADRSILHPPTLQGAKVATRALVGAFGGQEAAEAETGRSQSRWSAYGGANTPDFIPLDMIDALEERTAGLPGAPHVTRWLCRRRGGMFLPLPSPGAMGARWGRLSAEIAKDAGALVGGICTDLDLENDVTPSEARERLKDAGELIRVAVELEAALKARAEEGRD